MPTVGTLLTIGSRYRGIFALYGFCRHSIHFPVYIMTILYTEYRITYIITYWVYIPIIYILSDFAPGARQQETWVYRDL